MAIEIYKYLFPEETQQGQGRGANGKRRISKIILGSLILMAMTAAGVGVLNDAKWVQSLFKQLSEKYDIKKSQFNNAYNNIVKYFSYEYQDSNEDLAGTVPNDYFAANDGFSDDEDFSTPPMSEDEDPMSGKGLSQMKSVARKHNTQMKRRVRKGVKAGKKAVKNAVHGLKVSDISDML